MPSLPQQQLARGAMPLRQSPSQYQLAPADCLERRNCPLLSLQPCPWGC